MTLDVPTCPFCGEPEELSLFEIWEDGNFQLSTCCLWLLEHISAEIDADPRWGRDLLRHLGAEDLTGHRLRRVSDGQGNGPVLDWQLRVRDVSFPVARAFIDKHHQHVGAPHVIWTTCISTGTPDSVGVPCGQMERSNGKIWDPARGCH